MSKAFTKETDDAPEQPLARRRELDLPPGTKNYLTPAGARALRDELDALARVPAPDAATRTLIQDLVTLRLPRGSAEREVIAISYTS